MQFRSLSSLTRGPGGLLAFLFTFLLASVWAESINSSTYVFSEDGANLNLTVSAAADTNDLYFRLSAPADYDWVAFGIGSQMKGALMFVVYPALNGTAITLSPRLSTGNVEPSYSSQINAHLVNDTAFPNYLNATDGGQMQLSMLCRNCVHWSSPPLDLSSKAAPFMWAVGPVNTGTTIGWYNALDAPLRTHSMATTFTLDMTQATVASNPNGTFPALGSKSSGASKTGDVTQGTSFTAIHGITMIMALVIVLPFDMLLRLCVKSIKVHVVMMGIMSILFITGIALSFVLSPQFNRSKSYSSPHQALGLLIFALYLLQFPLGLLSHRRQRLSRTSANPPPRLPLSSPTRLLSLLHPALGWFLLFLGVITAGLGFNLALTKVYVEVWVPIVIGVFVVLLIASGVKYMWRTSKKDAKREADDLFKLQEMMPPPAYQEREGMGGGGSNVVMGGERRYEQVQVPARH